MQRKKKCKCVGTGLFYDDINKQYIITGPLPFHSFWKRVEDEQNNHRMYYVTTPDFKTFSQTALFLDPSFSVIDAVIVKRAAADYVLVLKITPARANIK